MRKLLAVFLLMAAVIPSQAQPWGKGDTKDILRRVRAIAGFDVPPIHGQWFFVSPNDSNNNGSGISPEEATSSICSAYVKCTTGAGDGIIVFSQGTALSQTNNPMVQEIDWSKHGITVVGACAPTRFGKRARVGSGAGLGGDTLAYLITLSGNNNAFYNIQFVNEGDSTSAYGCVKVTGERNYFENCEFFNVGAAVAADTLVHSLQLHTASENTFVRCAIGTDTIDRTVAALVGELWISGACGKNIFEDCYFEIRTNDVDHGLVKMISTTSLNGTLFFDNCKFVALYANVGIQALTTLFVGATPATGVIMMHDCSIAGWADVSPSAWNHVGTNQPAANGAGGIQVTAE